jgi:hypothetical protein
LKTTSGFELGAQVSGYKYEEPGIMKMTGVKIGLTGTAIKDFGNDWYILGDLRYAFGDVDYTGSGDKSSNPDRLWDLRPIVGKDFWLGGSVLSTYAGLGYRTLFNDLRGTTSTGAEGYRRKSEYVYLPIGVAHRFQIGIGSGISTSLEYDYLINGTQTTYLSDLNIPGVGDQENSQKSGYGIRLSSAYEAERWSAGVFYNYWNIQESEKNIIRIGNTLYYSYEPKNNTDEFGVQVKYRF